MSYGICIIASKVGGIPEIIRDNGVLIENINSHKLKQNLIELIDNEKLRKSSIKQANSKRKSIKKNLVKRKAKKKR